MLTPAMPQSLVYAFIAGCTAMVVLVAAYFIKRWIESVDGLKTAINGLNATVANSTAVQAVHAEKLDQHRGELDELWNLSCQNPACPHRMDRRRKT